ncbi:hypothetical protein [Luteimonas aquatica]|uniref:hypothetical protein n=1 Tax=Luteimonas aquatica TaxID=450364 RepID=UPI001F59125F|nr:hypothetical protein [Luteimonas aquatica]
MAEDRSFVLQAYGLFMVAWSVLETVVEAAIMKELLIGPERSLIVTSSMQFRQRVSVLSSLLKLRDPQPSEALRLLRKIEKIAKRNAIVHGHIVVGVPGQLTFVKSSAVDGYSAKHFTFTAQDLAGHTGRLADETKKLQNLMSVSDADIQTLADVGIKASGHAP